MKVYLIQGFFFQDQMWLDVGLGESGKARGVEVIPVVATGLCRFMYSGILFPGKEADNSAYAGQMNDHFGESDLSEVKIVEDHVSFVKKYTKRGDLIYYTFKKRGNLWLGTFYGDVVGQGTAKCLITEAPVRLFDSEL